MNKKIKRVVSSVLVVSVVFLLLFGEAAYVQATEVNEEAYTIEDEIGDVVEEFYDDLEWKISNITPIYNNIGEIIQYAINISANDINYGYFIYDISNQKLIKFMVERYHGGFVETYFPEENLENKKVIFKDEFTYDLVDYENSTDEVGAFYDKSINKTNELFSIFLDNYQYILNDYKLALSRYIPRVYKFGQDYCDEINKEYCCAAVAILNVLAHYNCFKTWDKDSILWAYYTIYSMGGVKKYGQEYVMNQNNIGYVVSTFAKWYGKINNMPYSAQNNPSSAFFVDAVNNKYPSILGISTKCYSDDNKRWEICGHAVTVYGYLRFKSKKNNSSKYFLCVANSWDTGIIEYIAYDDIRLHSSYGIKFMHVYK